MSCGDQQSSGGNAGYRKAPPSRPKKRRQLTTYSDSSVKRISTTTDKKRKHSDGCQHTMKFIYAENLSLIKNLVPEYKKLLGLHILKTDQAWDRMTWAMNSVGEAPCSEDHVKK